jgi:2'-hydroxyisoflavone reductase
MRLLILGGTRFLGRAIVDAAIGKGHEVTLFNRGQSNPELYPQLERLTGDRDGGLDALRGRHWDRVIDTCGFGPRIVRQSAELLAEAVDHYTFISTLSVYADSSRRGMDENGPLAVMDDETVEEITGETYGPLKVLCEQAVTQAMSLGMQDERSLHVRAGLIVGPHDLSDRFTYWPYRISKGGEVLAPGDPHALVQLVDVRDLAEWTVNSAEERLTGPYNVTGPGTRLTMGEVLNRCQEVTGSDTSLTWVSDEFLLENEVAPYTEAPLWVPGEDYAGFSTFDCSRAIEAGLIFRPISQTIADTHRWQATRPSDHVWRGGLSPGREAALLDIWRRR